jgi:hypothetical protein
MVLYLVDIAKPSRREGKDKAKTMSSTREPKLHNPLGLLQRSKALELSSAKTVNLALTFWPYEVYSKPITPPNSIKTSTYSCLCGRYTYSGEDEKYSGRSIKSWEQDILEY